MARYKLVDRSPRLLPIVLDAQLMAGSFECAVDYLIDQEIDLSGIDERYVNDETGAPAYDPAVMLKIVLLAYSRGMVSSRTIERLCRENVLFMAISGDSAPQFTTIAKFVRELAGEVAAIFTQVLMICAPRDSAAIREVEGHSRNLRPSRREIDQRVSRRGAVGGMGWLSLLPLGVEIPHHLSTRVGRAAVPGCLDHRP